MNDSEWQQTVYSINFVTSCIYLHLLGNTFMLGPIAIKIKASTVTNTPNSDTCICVNSNPIKTFSVLSVSIPHVQSLPSQFPCYVFQQTHISH